MNPIEPPDERDDGATTPTIVEGFSFEDLRDELDDRDLSNIRAFLGRVDAESRRSVGDATHVAALGPFRDLVEIGRGGMGVVYRTIDPKTGDEVAVKVPSPGLTPLPGARRMFDKEAEAVGRLNHPAIVPHRRLVADGGRYLIVSDFCDGPDLERWLQARKVPAPARQAARIMAELAGAVAHAHQRGVLHRDVKPSNVLLPGSTETSDAMSLSPRLTDFGLAKLMDDGQAPMQAATATGLVMGSPPYMAPEQASGRRQLVDRRTDVYGLGAVLYELLTLRPPFRGDTPAETLGMVMADEPVPPRVLRPGIPRALEAIVLQCLEKSPERRYATADALRDDLQAFLAGRRVQARRPGPAERLRRWARRRPRSAALAASTLAVALILAAGVAAWTVALSRGRDRADQYVYVSRLQLALRAYDDGQLVRTQPILRNLIPRAGERDRREFAWYYLWRHCRREARMVLVDDVDFDFDHLALSPSGSKLAGGGDVGMVIHDLDRESTDWIVPAAGMFVAESPVFSADGARVAFHLIDVEDTPDRMRAVEVRSVADGALLGRRTISNSRPIHTIGFLGDGRLNVFVRTASPDEPEAAECLFWSDRGDLADAAPPVRFRVFCAYTANGLRSLVVDAEGRLCVYDAASGSFTPLHDGPTEELAHCKFSDDGDRVVVTHGPDGKALLYDARDGRLLRSLPALGEPAAQVAIQPGGEAILVRTASQAVRLIDPGRELDLCIFEPGSEPGVETKNVRFTPDGRGFLVHRSEYRGADHIEIRSADDGLRLGESPARYKALAGPWAIRPGARPELIYALGRHAWRWEWSQTVAPSPDDHLKAHNDEAWAVVYSADGSLMATVSDNETERATIRLRTPDGRLIREWEDVDSTASDVAFAPDASWIATAHLYEKRALRIRPTRGDGEVVSVELPDGEWARGVGVAPDRPVVYVGGDRGTILAWDVDQRRVLWTIMPPPERRVPKTHDRIHDLAVAPDGGRLAVVDDRGIVRIVDARNGSVAASYEGRSPMLATAYSPDGNVIAAGDQEGRIHILDAKTARLLQVIPGDDCDLRSLAFSPDGRTLAAAGVGRVVRLWDPVTGEELLSLTGHEAQINSLGFSPDGETLASADHSGIVRFWRAPRPAAR